ncbi:helix-turn-helix domain-containing protein [Clostridium sp.]|uniref:helix-turn-helix domain-containing protein n=1 Tax=Clostridium sp. TaxID=1506 RepID=UPI001D716788|nr:helix-turn-helix domain-containing protein [Clostridium sp.]MBS5937729.1 helix-turn-helix domain-containing protein [Clostridium sp.]
MNNYEKGYFNLKNNAILELPSHLFRTYSYMVSKDFKGEGIWHSQQTIANDLKVSVRTVQRHIKALAQLSYISVKRRGFNKTNLMKCLKSIVSKVKEKKEEMANNFKKNFNNKPKNKLRFDNFTGRGADYYGNSDLEKKLLGWE